MDSEAAEEMASSLADPQLRNVGRRASAAASLGTFTLTWRTAHMNSNRRKLLTVAAIVALLVVSVLVAVSLYRLDPLRQYVSSDGKITLHGSVTGPFLDYLLHGPRQGTLMLERYVLGPSAYPTAAMVVVSLAPRAYSPGAGASMDLAAGVRAIGGAVYSAMVSVSDSFSYVLHDVAGRISSFFFMDARAAGCTGTGNCYWKSAASASWSTTADWFTATNGGGSSGGLPGTGDAVWFDANSCGAAYTISLAANTQVAAFSLANANCTIDTTAANHYNLTVTSLTTSAGTFLAQASTIQLNATSNMAGATFTSATSTFDIATSLTLTASGSAYYNVIVDAGKTLTTAGATLLVNNVLTINGTLTLGANGTTLRDTTSTANPLVFGASGATAGGYTITFQPSTGNNGTPIIVPAWTYTNTVLQFRSDISVAGDGFEFSLAGDITAAGLGFRPNTSNPFFLSTSTHNVTITGTGTIYDLSIGNPGASGYGIKATSGTWIVPGGLLINDGANSAAFYMQLGSTVWTVGGPWTNSSTTYSAKWQGGTSTVTFDSTTSQTMTFANLGSTDEFFNVTFDSGANTATYTMSANALKWGGQLNVTGGAGVTSLATANLGLTGGSLVIGNAGVLTANASTVVTTGVTMTGGASGTITLTTGSWSVTGSWDTSGAGSTFTQGTSGVTLNGLGAVKLLAGQAFATLFLNGSATINAQSALVASTLTITGEVLAKAMQPITVNGNLTVQSGGAITSTAGDVIVTGNLDVADATSYLNMGSETWTVSGTWSNSSTSVSWSSGTSTVILDSATGGTIANAASLTVPEFYNLTVDSTAATAQTFTISHNVEIANTLTVTDAASTTTLDVGASSFGITTKNVVVSSGGIAKLRAADLTVTGNWTDTGTNAWTAWTGSLALSGSTAEAISAKHALPDVSMTGAGTKTFTASFTTGSVTTAAASKWIISAGVTYTIVAGSLIDAAGLITWDGTVAQPITITSTGSWSFDTHQRSLDVAYVNVTNSRVQNGYLIYDCTGSDGGGNEGWVFSNCAVHTITGTVLPDVSQILLVALGLVVLIGAFSFVFFLVRKPFEDAGETIQGQDKKE